MIDFLKNPLTIIFVLFFILSLFALQAFILYRIRNILKNMSAYIENISRFLFRVSVPTNTTAKYDLMPRTCQFCKYRLSFIHMGKEESEAEDFYYKCRLKNIEISLEDSCEKFENEKMS